MSVCFEHEIALPTDLGILVWTASGPGHLTDETRERKMVYKLFSFNSFFSEVGNEYSKMIDGDDQWITPDIRISQENQAEDMPVFSLAGTSIKY